MLITFIVLYILLTLGIGFWASRKIKSSNDFILAGRRLGPVMVGFTLFATWFGSSQVMGNPGYFVREGVSSFITLTLSGSIALVLIGYFFARKLYNLRISTVADYFRHRYGKSVEPPVMFISIMAFPHWIAAQFVALAFVMQVALDLDPSIGLAAAALIVTIYTFAGGMWAVTVTDLIQGILIIIGMFALLFYVLGSLGGISPMLENKPESFYSIFPEEGLASWSEYIATFLALCAGAIPAQEIYQRMFTARSVRAARNGLYLGAFLNTLMPSIPLVIALGAVTLHPEWAMGESGGQNIIPLFVDEYMGLPLQVLFYGALISAIMSTSSGATLSAGTLAVENFLKPLFTHMTDRRRLWWTRLSVVAIAGISYYLAAGDLDIVNLVVASLSLVLVCLFVPFTAGLIWKRANTAGAWSAMMAGAGVWLVCYLVETTVDPTIYGLFGSMAGMVAGSFFSGKVQTGSTE